MKAIIELPDHLFRRAKSMAVQRGISLRALVSEALTEKLNASQSEDKPWMKTFGKLAYLHKETLRIGKIIEEEFGQIEAEDGA